MSLATSENTATIFLTAGGSFSWDIPASEDLPISNVKVSVVTDPVDAPSWDVKITDNGSGWDNYTGKQTGEFHPLITHESKFTLKLTCPRGARYDDKVTVNLIISSNERMREISYSAVATPSIVALKTRIGQEKDVAKSLYNIFRKESKESREDTYIVDSTTFTEDECKHHDVYSVLCPAGLSGYVFVEGMNTDRMREKTKGIKKARSFVDGETDVNEIEHYLTPLSPVIGIAEGDIVELINGPFKGEKARVFKIDKEREEITVELIEAMVPIPVTVTGESVKLIEKEK
ncbi:MAG: transcription elongation factor Spt5 [archaeon]|nr:transcription elongation factor Spt5 [archaeon]